MEIHPQLATTETRLSRPDIPSLRRLTSVDSVDTTASWEQPEGTIRTAASTTSRHHRQTHSQPTTTVPPLQRTGRSLSLLCIEIDNNRTTFLPGQRLEGHVAFTLSQPCEVKLVRIRFVGHVVTHIYKNDAGQVNMAFTSNSSHITLFKDLVTCVGNTSLTEPPVMMEAGDHVYPFSFRFPAMNLPCSFEGPFGRVRYEVAAVLVRPGHANKTCCVPLTVPCTMDARDPIYNPLVSTQVKETIGRWLWTSGHVEMKLSLPRQAYASEETLPFRIDILNQSSAFLQLKDICIKQKVTYKTADDVRGPQTEKIHKLHFTETFPPPLKRITRLIHFPIPLAQSMTPDIRTAILQVEHVVCCKLVAYPLSKKVKKPDVFYDHVVMDTGSLEPRKSPLLLSTLSTQPALLKKNRWEKWMFWKSSEKMCQEPEETAFKGDPEPENDTRHRAVSWNGHATSAISQPSSGPPSLIHRTESHVKPHRQSLSACITTNSILVPRKNALFKQTIKASLPVIIGGFPHMLLELFNDDAESIHTLPEYEKNVVQGLPEETESHIEESHSQVPAITLSHVQDTCSDVSESDQVPFQLKLHQDEACDV